MSSNIEFKNGFAEGFEFALPECFRDPLNRKNFSVGDVFYDNRSAYDSTWGEALKSFTVCLQIQQSFPSFIKFSIQKPNKERNALETVDTKTATVDDFYDILKTGLK
ncbi:hypothetical protein MLD52_18950 [Puniceicoccaceae bacterium K14]|nr:hypothetical protein [Puniceicoccaceae bacterium K14]